MAAMGLARTVLTYASETTTNFRQVCCFNLQQGPGVVTLDSTKVGETDTRQPPMCEARPYNQSCISVRVMSVRAASFNNTAESKYDMLVSSMTIIAHNSLCSTRAYNIYA